MGGSEHLEAPLGPTQLGYAMHDDKSKLSRCCEPGFMLPERGSAMHALPELKGRCECLPLEGGSVLPESGEPV